MIKLQKIPFAKALTVLTAIKAYREHLLNMGVAINDIDKIYLSIIEELYYKISPKFNKIEVPKTISIKLLWHQAKALLNAFLVYQDQIFSTDLDHAVIENLKLELHQQIVK